MESIPAAGELIQVWLEKVFGGDSVPAYELNQRTIQTLYKLMKLNEARDKDVSIIVEDMRQKTEEYNSEARRIEDVMKTINLPIASLSQSGVMSLRTLANVALLLQTKDVSETSYLLALQHLHTDLHKTNEELKCAERLTQTLIEKNKRAVHKYNLLKKAADDLEEQKVKQRPEIERRAKESGFLYSKAKEYKEKVNQFQNELVRSKADPAIHHSALVKMSEELQSLVNQLSPLKTKLQTYHSLPPDVSLTKVKIEELRQELARLEAELSRRIDLAHM